MSVEIPTETEVTENYIKASEWVKRGSMIVRRDCLDITDPDSYFNLWYNKWRAVLPVDMQRKIYGEVIVLSTEGFLNALKESKIEYYEW